MEIEEAALKKEDDELSKERLQELQKELAEMRDSFNAMKAKWENEKNAIGKVQKLREQIETAERRDRAAPSRTTTWNKAAELKYGKLPAAAKRQLEEEEQHGPGRASRAACCGIR